MSSLAAQLNLFDALAPEKSKVDTSSTFSENARRPVHRWFRFSAGFSAEWAQSVITDASARHVLDPFAGSGTTLLAAEDAGVEALGVEAHSFIFRVASAKLLRSSSVEGYLALAAGVREAATRNKHGELDRYPSLVRTCYPTSTLMRLDALRIAVEEAKDDTPAWHLVWMTLVCILRVTSPVGTAQWQYVLPGREKKRTIEAFSAYDAMVATIEMDMRASASAAKPARILCGDARMLTDIPDGWADLILTSPPYPNNYDYADATRLEMSFFGEVSSWSDLQSAVRRHLIRACSQHVPERTVDLATVLAAPELEVIRSELSAVCEELAQVRLSKAGKKTYHLMVACYFHDLARVWLALRRVCAVGGRACFVIGDSAPYGVHVPAERWLGELAMAAGFRSWRFDRIRDRNVKWKNRKHRVPLCEGRLWVEG